MYHNMHQLRMLLGRRWSAPELSRCSLPLVSTHVFVAAFTCASTWPALASVASGSASEASVPEAMFFAACAVPPRLVLCGFKAPWPAEARGGQVGFATGLRKLTSLGFVRPTPTRPACACHV